MSIKSRARVTVIGAGYLGLTHAVCLADLGHEVLAIDVDERLPGHQDLVHQRHGRGVRGHRGRRGRPGPRARSRRADRRPVPAAGAGPSSDDIRDSPSLDICGRLAEAGAVVSVHDPVAMPNASRARPDLRFAASVSDAAQDARVVLHLTEWADYQAIDPAALGRVVAQRSIVDARCALDAAAWQAAGWTVRILGRP